MDSRVMAFMEDAQMDREPLDRLLKIKQVTALTGLSESTIDRRIEDGTFPKALRIGPRATRWRESAIREWLDGLKPSGGET